jgi:hypothetical protein
MARVPVAQNVKGGQVGVAEPQLSADSVQLMELQFKLKACFQRHQEVALVAILQQAGAAGVRHSPEQASAPPSCFLTAPILWSVAMWSGLATNRLLWQLFSVCDLSGVSLSSGESTPFWLMWDAVAGPWMNPIKSCPQQVGAINSFKANCGGVLQPEASVGGLLN